MAREAHLDVAGGLPGAGEVVVVVLHWFLWLVTAFPSCCLLAGTQDKGGGGRRWWSSLGARRAQLIKGGGQGTGALFVLDPLFSVGFHGAHSARRLEVVFVLARIPGFEGPCGLVCVVIVFQVFLLFLSSLVSRL